MLLRELKEWNGVIFFFFQAEDGIRDYKVTGVQTCALPISARARERVGGIAGAARRVARRRRHLWRRRTYRRDSSRRRRRRRAGSGSGCDRIDRKSVV